MLWHQELASLVQGRTSRPELQRLAVSIHTTQNIDVAQMTAWFRARDPPPVTTWSTPIPNPRTDGSPG